MPSESGSNSSRNIYHERQSSFNQLCLVHAINMILGAPKVQKDTLDQICETLCPDGKWWNDHRSVLGTGNYDANVAMYALDELGYHVSFFDTRKAPDQIPLDKCGGLLLNIKGFLPYSRHWIGCRKVDESWYLLDSQKAGPIELSDVVQKMKDYISLGAHILVLTKKE